MAGLYTAVLLSATALASGPAALPGEGRTPTSGGEQYVHTTRRALNVLRENLSHFQLSLTYHGPDSARFPSLHLGVDPSATTPPAARPIAINRDQAAVLLGYLAGDGFLYRGAVSRTKLLAPPKGPYFFLLVKCTEEEQYYEYLPLADKPYRWHWMSRPPLNDQLDGLRSVLDGTAAETLDRIAGALAEAETKGEPTAAEGD
jgi:hypothetical protein